MEGKAIGGDCYGRYCSFRRFFNALLAGYSPLYREKGKVQQVCCIMKKFAELSCDIQFSMTILIDNFVKNFLSFYLRDLKNKLNFANDTIINTQMQGWRVPCTVLIGT